MSLLWSLVYVFNFIIDGFIFHKQLEHINSKKAKVILLLVHHLNPFPVFEAKVVVLRFQMFTYYAQPQVPLMWYYLKIIPWHLGLDIYAIWLLSITFAFNNWTPFSASPESLFFP